jgi:hypothetical protein
MEGVLHIELLWIIPIISFVIFIFILIFNAQRKADATDLSREVDTFNSGDSSENSHSKKSGRLSEIENAISMMTQSLGTQQEMIGRFQKENTTSSGEINELKAKLRELYKEYDIVLSENYSLRAKVKKLMEQDGSTKQGDEPLPRKPLPAKPSKTSLNLLEDTKLLSTSGLDDTKELDISDIR